VKVIKVFDIETANARFQLTISETADGKGYVGEYYGTTPKYAQVVRPGAPIPVMKDMGSGKLTNQNLPTLIAACRAEIEKRDGKIKETIERQS
jgi:hypothetical protein